MTTSVRVGIHPFQTYSRHPGRDGANLAYEEAYRLLEAAGGVSLVPHDFLRVCRDDDYARDVLGPCDVVVSNVGPLGFIYFYLRQKLRLRYRILRDVRTALWNGYLLQEWLVAPYAQADDSVIFPSAYARDLFSALFPLTDPRAQHVCYPLLREFPAVGAERRRAPGDPLTIGFVGRLTADKNFPQALDLLEELNSRGSRRFRLLAVGQQSADGARQVNRRLGRLRGMYRYVRPVAWTDIWAVLQDIDVLFFPSTSSLETFGRVLAEASHASVPVVASTHGASPELVDVSGLVPTTYRGPERLSVRAAAALGAIDVADAAARIREGVPVPSTNYRRYQGDDRRFIQIVMQGNSVGPDPETRTAASEARSFIARVQVDGMDPVSGPAVMDEMLSASQGHLKNLHRHLGPSYLGALARTLWVSPDRARTGAFIRRSVLHGEDFTNIGGIDLQLSHLLGFAPTFAIGPGRAFEPHV